MKKTELDMAVNILQKIQKDYTKLFDKDGHRFEFYSNPNRLTLLHSSRTATGTVEELRYVRRLLLEVAKELG